MTTAAGTEPGTNPGHDPAAPRSGGRFSLAVKLSLGIFGAAGLVLAAGMVAFLAFFEIDRQHTTITENTLPAMTGALMLAQESTNIATAAPRLLAARTEAECREVLAALRGNIGVVIQLSGALERGRAEQADPRLQRIGILGTAIRDAFEQIGAAVARRLSLGARLATHSALAASAYLRFKQTVGPLLDEETFYLVTGYRALGDQAPVPAPDRVSMDGLLRYEALHRLNAEGAVLSEILAETTTLTQPERIGPLQERFEAARSGVERAVTELDGGDARAEITEQVRFLWSFGPGEDGIFALREAILESDAEAQALLDHNRTVTRELVQVVEAVVADARSNTTRAVVDAGTAIAVGSAFLAGILLLSVVGALVAALGGVGRTLTQPVLQITAAAAALEAGRFRPASLAETAARGDELGQLAAVFTRMAEKLQADAENLERVVAERARAVDSSNRKLAEALRRIETELAAASGMQSLLVPRRLPDRPELFGMIRAARAFGGNFYDIVPLGADRIGLVIGDVSGTGLPAALLKSVSLTVLRACAVADPAASPGTVLAAVNNMLTENNHLRLYVSVFFAILDRAAGTLCYANGGHVPPMWVDRDGAVAVLDGRADDAVRDGAGIGTGLGVVAGEIYCDRTVLLGEGDLIICTSDGVTEAVDAGGTAYGEQRLLERVAQWRRLPAAALGRQLIDDLEAFVAGAPQTDDITVLVVRQVR